MSTELPAAGTPRLRSAVPTFLVGDVAATARWYHRELGFTVAGNFPEQEPYLFASVQRDNAEIMLLSLADYRKPDLSALRPAGLWDVYLRTRGVRALFEAVRGKRWIRSPLVKRNYGDWEFEVEDPNGYFLVFGGEE